MKSQTWLDKAAEAMQPFVLQSLAKGGHKNSLIILEEVKQCPLAMDEPLDRRRAIVMAALLRLIKAKYVCQDKLDLYLLTKAGEIRAHKLRCEWVVAQQRQKEDIDPNVWLSSVGLKADYEEAQVEGGV